MCVACVLFAICAAGYLCLQGMKVKNNKLWKQQIVHFFLLFRHAF